MKKLISLALSLLMLFSFASVAFADETPGTTPTYSITIKNTASGHTYEAYQIFKGEISGSKLVSIEWGADVNKTSLITALNASGLFSSNIATDASAEAVAEAIGELGDAEAEKLAKAIGSSLTGTASGSTSSKNEDNYVISGLSAGYYLVKDKDDSQNDKHDAYTAFILQLTKDEDVSVNAKSALPTVDKQVWDDLTDAEENADDGWGESADHEINEVFKFKLIAKIPADKNLKLYDTYTITFHDIMSEGITFDSIESVYVGQNELTAEKYSMSEISKEATGIQKWSLTIHDVKSICDENFGNNSFEVQVIYKAHLNENAYVSTADGTTENKNTVYLTYSNNPNGTNKGQTPEDSVWVFTYRVDNTKYSENTDEQNLLPGAEFKLYKTKTGTGKDAEYSNEVKLIYDSALKAYRPVKGDETAEAMVSGDGENAGKFNIVGLDHGNYYLVETKAPVGYKELTDAIEVVINATHIEENSRPAEVTFTNDSQHMNNNIINKMGASLPTTGGIGTTIFYVVGAVLMFGAAILLVTKKRMSAEK